MRQSSSASRRQSNSRSPTFRFARANNRQGDNPSQQSRQHQEAIRLRTYIIPAGARLEGSTGPAINPGMATTNRQSFVLSTPMSVTDREEIRTAAELGAA